MGLVFSFVDIGSFFFIIVVIRNLFSLFLKGYFIVW